MGLRSRIKGRLKGLLGAAQERKTSGSFQTQQSDTPMGTARGMASPPPSEEASRPSPPSPSPPSPPSPSVPETSAKRRIIKAPIVVPVAPAVDGELRIKAEPQKDNMTCRLMASESLLPGNSWFFENAESTHDSPLAERLFELDGVESVIVDDTTVTLTRDGEGDWEPLARAAGVVIRECLTSNTPLISADLVASIPDEETITTAIQTCIDDEVNPGVAAHSGYITLTRVRGNSVYIEMGGGCQGCSAADLTLKQGIHEAFRNALPQLGAIYDDTDHAAGLNPYFT